MKRYSSSLLLVGALAAATSVGCQSDKKKDPMASDGSKYKILNGSTAENPSSHDDPQAVAPEPSLNANTRFAAGRLAESQEKFDCAIVQYEQALRLDPNHVPSLYRLGVVQTKMKDYVRAEDAWKQYIKATKGIASGYSNLGFCYEMAGDVPSAEQAYKQGIERDSKNEACRVNYGLMLARQNRVDEAKEQLSVVLKPDEVSYDVAAIYEQQGAYAQAKTELKRALLVNPKNTAAEQKLAALPADKNDTAAAPTEIIDGTQGGQPRTQESKTSQEPIDKN